MSFLDRLFRKKNSRVNRVPIKFGRYNENYRSPLRQDAWDQALDSFADDQFLEALEQLLIYLNHGEEHNVKWERSTNKIEFALQQGSMIVNGWANILEFHAHAEVCKFSEPNPKLFLSLLEVNYDLTYCKYVLHGNSIMLKFNSQSLDASPVKLYQGLRELALLGDKQDDLIQGDFGQELGLNVAWIKPLPTHELTVKQEYLRVQLEELKSDYQHCGLDPTEYAGAFAYLILNTCYKLDYLLKPEGELMDLFERVHRGYFGPEGAMSIARNDGFFKEIQETITERLDEIHKECYAVVYTFGYTTDVSLQRVQSFILEEVEKMDWYVREGHREVGLAIPGYIVGYSLFHYALPSPLPVLFALYYEVVDAQFFKDLGFSPSLLENGMLNSENIIKRIYESTKTEIGWSKANIKEQLRFESVYHFTKSYLIMIGNLTLK